MEYEEHNRSITVPKSTGLEGFLHAIKKILTLPNIQRIEITNKGEVSYRYFSPKDSSPEPLGIDFETLEPYAVIRNSKVVELQKPSLNAAVSLCQLFSMAAADKLHPIGFAGGPASDVWAWYEESVSLPIGDRDTLLGLPYWPDRMFEDSVLVLCAGFARDGSLIDTQKAYKLCIPKIPQVPNVR